MKTLFIAILVLCLTTLHAERSSVTAQGAFNQVLPALPVQPIVLTPRDPYRIWDDKLYTLTGVDERNGWVEFTGKIWNVQPAGVCIKGFYTGSGDGPDGDGVDFFVADFPYEVAEDESIGRNMRTMTFYLAKENGVYTYNTAVGGTKTLRKLE